MELFRICTVCKGALQVAVKKLGTMITILYDCGYCESHKSWQSQAMTGQTPVGNVQLSAAVYLSGASYSKMEKVNEESVTPVL